MKRGKQEAHVQKYLFIIAYQSFLHSLPFAVYCSVVNEFLEIRHSGQTKSTRHY